jgi:hypothetical protein
MRPFMIPIISMGHSFGPLRNKPESVPYPKCAKIANKVCTWGSESWDWRYIYKCHQPQLYKRGVVQYVTHRYGAWRFHVVNHAYSIRRHLNKDIRWWCWYDLTSNTYKFSAHRHLPFSMQRDSEFLDRRNFLSTFLSSIPMWYIASQSLGHLHWE